MIRILWSFFYILKKIDISQNNRESLCASCIVILMAGMVLFEYLGFISEEYNIFLEDFWRYVLLFVFTITAFVFDKRIFQYFGLIVASVFLTVFVMFIVHFGSHFGRMSVEAKMWIIILILPGKVVYMLPEMVLLGSIGYGLGYVLKKMLSYDNIVLRDIAYLILMSALLYLGYKFTFIGRDIFSKYNHDDIVHIRRHVPEFNRRCSYAVFRTKGAKKLKIQSIIDMGIYRGLYMLDKQGNLVNDFGGKITVDYDTNRLKITYQHVPGGKICRAYCESNTGSFGFDTLYINDIAIEYGSSFERGDSRRVAELCYAFEDVNVSFVASKDIMQYSYYFDKTAMEKLFSILAKSEDIMVDQEISYKDESGNIITYFNGGWSKIEWHDPYDDFFK
ncbi:hypothetical protein [Hydrogenimonas sp.]